MKRLSILIVGLFALVGVSMAQEMSQMKVKLNKGSINLISEDGAFKFTFGGRVFMDAATYFDDKTDLASGSEFRDLRMLMRATLWKNWDAKINIGFASGAVSLKDVYLQYNIDKNSYVRGGYYLEPFGIEQTESSKTPKFLNVSSTVEAFRPGRNMGITYGRWGNQYKIVAGLFGGDATNKSNGDESIGLISRFAFSPVHTKGKIAHMGVSGTFRSAGETENKGAFVKEFRYRSRPATHIEKRRFIDAKIENANHELKYGADAIFALGSWSIQSEYIQTKVNFENQAGAKKDYMAHGWYAQLGFLLKGRDYQYKMKSARLTKPSSGSLELMFRINQTDLNDKSVAILGGKQTDYSVGCTWYINHNILAKLNFTNVDLDEYALNGEENFNMIQTRLQFSF